MSLQWKKTLWSLNSLIETKEEKTSKLVNYVTKLRKLFGTKQPTEEKENKRNSYVSLEIPEDEIKRKGD